MPFLIHIVRYVSFVLSIKKYKYYESDEKIINDSCSFCCYE
jgi:hypothetical protein